MDVLPLLIEKCELPGFLKGKLYADFLEPEHYEMALGNRDDGNWDNYQCKMLAKTIDVAAHAPDLDRIARSGLNGSCDGKRFTISVKNMRNIDFPF